MKKLFNSMITIFLLSGLILTGLISCANTVTPNTPSAGSGIGNGGNFDGSIDSSSVIEISLKAPEGAIRFDIQRKKNKDDQWNDDYRISGDLPSDKVIDYFVEPNKTYYYKISYWGDNWKSLGEEEITETSGLNGMGELVMPITSVSYNESTGIMNFLPAPTFEKFNSIFDRGIRLSMGYDLKVTDTNGNNREINVWANMEPNNNKKYTGFLNWTTAHTNSNYDDFYGKELKLNILDLEVSKNNQWYRMRYSDYGEKIESVLINVPKTIIVPDTRIIVNANSTNETKGIQFTIPSEIPEGTKRINVGRLEIIPDVETYMDEYYISLPLENITSFTDYFVTTGNKYKYVFFFRDDNGNVLNKSKPIEITAESGVGPLSISKETQVTYDDKTGIMKFNPIPDYPELNGILTNEDEIECKFIYNMPNYEIWGTVNKEDGTINWAKVIANRSENFDNNNWNLRAAELSANIKNIKFRTWVEKEKIIAAVPSITDYVTIKIPDTRCELKLDQCSEGVKINMPSDLPNDVDCNIYRKEVGRNDWDSIYVGINNFTGDKRNYIIDYFVEPGTEYEYYVYFQRNIGTQGNWYWETVAKTKFSKITPTNGTGVLELGNTPATQYDSTTCVLTYNPIPEFTQNLQNFIETNKAYSCFRIGYGYYDNNGRGHRYDRRINKDFYKVDYGESFPVGTNLTLDLDFIEAQIELNGVNYGRYLPKEQFSGLHQSIYVTGKGSN